MKKAYILLFLFVFIVKGFALENNMTKDYVQSLEKPMYTPFVENYILNEIRRLRDENRELKAYVATKIAEKEVIVTDRVMNYSTSTVMNMFYIIAAASSILVLLGWNSMRDLRERMKLSMDEKVHELIKNNEDRMKQIEEDLAKRSQLVLANQEEISKTNAIHSLWMRAGLEATPSGKMEIYNQILKLRPEDPEVISYKADAALEMNESNWALNLSNHALDIAPDYPNAYFQRARAYITLGFMDNAMDDLEKTCELNEQYLDTIKQNKEFEILYEERRYKKLIDKYEISLDEE